MIRIDRLNDMEQYIIEKGTASLDELAETFQLSLITVRRDIANLADRGNIEKVYGGVCAIKNEVALKPLAIRSIENSAAKVAIGRRAAALIKNGSSIFLDSGSTAVMLIPFLAEKENITIITHSLTAMYEASQYPSISVFALGGLYHTATASYVGMSTIQGIERMHFDTVFLSATGVSIENGLNNITYLETEIKRAVVAQNEFKNITLLADQSKFGRSALFTFCKLEELTTVVTDSQPEAPFMDQFNKFNVHCVYTD